MALVPWKGGDLERLRREMDRMFDRLWRGEAGVPAERAWAPEVDISETEDEVIVRSELPGLAPEEIDVHLAGRTLTLRGEKRQEREEEGETWRLVERTYGSFSRAVELPAEVEPEEVEATYRHGVLTVRLPKSEQARTKKIEVTTT